jgi:hypothetical protein
VKNLVSVIGIVVSVAVLAAAHPAQQKPAPPAPPVNYTISEVESLKLQVAQKDVQLAQMNFIGASNAFRATEDAIRKAHGWPDTVTLNPQTLRFQGPPAPPAAPPATAPAPAAPDMTKPTGPPVQPAAKPTPEK